MDYGTVGQSVGIPRVPIGTVGWDGEVGWQYGLWDSGSVCGNPTCTHWYSGMGRTGGIAVWTMGQSMGIPSMPFAKHHVGLVKVPMSQWTLVGKTGHYWTMRHHVLDCVCSNATCL